MWQIKNENEKKMKWNFHFPKCRIYWNYFVLLFTTQKVFLLSLEERPTFPWLCSRSLTVSPTTFRHVDGGWRPLDGIPLLTKSGSSTTGHQGRDQQDDSLQYISGIEKWHAISLPQQVNRDCELVTDPTCSTASSHNSPVAPPWLTGIRETQSFWQFSLAVCVIEDARMRAWFRLSGGMKLFPNSKTQN